MDLGMASRDPQLIKWLVSVFSTGAVITAGASLVSPLEFRISLPA